MNSARAWFEPTPDGSRFMLAHDPVGEPRGTIVYAPPFAEEMNRSRRMAAMAARAFAQAGWRVLMPDLRGCGDSAGDHGDVVWIDWVEDLRRVIAQADPSRPLWLWALRGGALFVPAMLEQRPDAHVLLWHPVVDGQQQLQQFLRLKSAGSVAGAGESVDRKTLLAQLERGESIEVAGYTLAPGLALGMAAARCTPRLKQLGRAVWMDVGATSSVEPSPGTAMRLNAWREAGWRVEFEMVEGLPFWQTQEIAECEALITHSIHQINRELP
ncbi:MAG TPA: hydrolase 2, exosortase A system-associated [Burkholderiaceae bacterium]|nr:hydrolase 2, exosortase A system-associated [Burkholderiaceae bacterium]